MLRNPAHVPFGFSGMSESISLVPPSHSRDNNSNILIQVIVAPLKRVVIT